jgi:hypothetical protein
MHIMRYVGRFEINYKELKSNPLKYINSSSLSANVKPFPKDYEGIKFYCMENMTKGKAIPIFVMVQDLKLKNPLEIDRVKHTDGKGIGPSGCSFGDESAKSILKDVAEINPEIQELISQIYEKYFGNSINVHLKTEDDKENSAIYYYPGRDDFENARRILYRKGKTRISLKETLNTIEWIVKKNKKNLHNNWRPVTGAKILIWMKKD